MKCTERDLNADPFETGNIKNLEILKVGFWMVKRKMVAKNYLAKTVYDINIFKLLYKMV